MPELQVEPALRGDHLRAGVVEGNERPAMPSIDRTGIFSECQFVRSVKFERFESDGPKRSHDKRVDEIYCPAQIRRTIDDLAASGSAVSIGCGSRAAHHRACNKDVFTRQIDRVEQFLKIITRLIAKERASRPVGSDPAGGLADEKDLRGKRAVELAQHGRFIRKVWADTANLCCQVKLSEKG